MRHDLRPALSAPRPRADAAPQLRPQPRPRPHAARLALALGVLGVAALSGCTALDGQGLTQVTTATHDTTYDPREIRPVGAPFPLQVFGAPPDGASAQAVAAGMTLPARFGSAPFTLEADPRSGPRIVVAFNPSNRFDGCDVDGPATGAVRDPAATEALVAYCYEGRERSSVLVRSTATRGPGDAGFATAMNHAFQSLLPAKGPNDEGDRPSRRFP